MNKKFLTTIVEEVEGEKLFVASDETLDRHGEVVKVDGIDITNYKNNPIVLAFHDHHQPPLGLAEKVGFKTINGVKKLVYDPIFHGKTELSRLYKELKDAGVTLASSIGFIPKEMDDNVITKSELLEISIVNVPANPEALSAAYQKGFDKAIVKEAMGDGFDQAEKELEDEKAKEEIEKIKEENEMLKKQIASLQDKSSQNGDDNGRKPEKAVGSKKETDVLRALKLVNKANEILNRTIKKD